MRLVLSVCVLLIALATSGCATIVGTVAGPVTGPLHADQYSRGVPPWFAPLVYPLSVPLGVLLGFSTGVAADVGYVLSGGEYGAGGHPSFGAIFHPTEADWGRYQPGEPLEEHGVAPAGGR